VAVFTRCKTENGYYSQHENCFFHRRLNFKSLCIITKVKNSKKIKKLQQSPSHFIQFTFLLVILRNFIEHPVDKHAAFRRAVLFRYLEIFINTHFYRNSRKVYK